jgi:hypothetical protein
MNSREEKTSNREGTISLMIREDAPTPEWMGLTGPALVALTMFKRDVYRPEICRKTPKVISVLKGLKIPIGLGAKFKLTEDQGDALQSRLSDPDLVNMAVELFKYGRPQLEVHACKEEDPDEKVVGNTTFVRNEIGVKRFHFMFYDDKEEAFRVPPYEDRLYDSLFYCSMNRMKVNIENLRKRNPEIAEFLWWQRKTMRELESMTWKMDILCGEIKIGEPKFKAQRFSQIRPEYVEMLILEDQRVEAFQGRREKAPHSIEEMKLDPEYPKEYNRMFQSVISGEVPIPKSQLVQYSGEQFVSFEVDPRFQPCKVVSQEYLSPQILLFEVPKNVEAQDKVVFNGSRLPWC